MNELTMNGIVFIGVIILSISIGFFVSSILAISKSKSFRKKHAIPNILGKWDCHWYDDELDQQKPKVVDVIEIKEWTRRGEFKAVGHQPQYYLKYPITGEIDPSRIITMEYKAARYPYETNRGVVIMILSRDGKTMEGKWYGRRSSDVLGGGRVFCKRMNASENYIN